MKEACIHDNVPGLDEALLATDYAEMTGRDLRLVISDIANNVILGVKHQGHWYVEAPPFYEEALDLLNARRRSRSRQSHGDNSQEDAHTPITDEKRFGAVLGLKGKLTKDDIRKAYRTAIAKYHPDKVHGLGIELQELAEKKSKEINQAFEYFSRKYDL
jgi:hypothetical protein